MGDPVLMALVFAGGLFIFLMGVFCHAIYGLSDSPPEAPGIIATRLGIAIMVISCIVIIVLSWPGVNPLGPQPGY